MMENLSKMEKFLDRKIETPDDRKISGLIDAEGTRVLYFSVSAKDQPRNIFNKITNFTNPPFAQSGGAHEDGCSITVPDGTKFYALKFRGDLDGWQKDIEQGAAAIKSRLGRIESSFFILEGGQKINLKMCVIEFS